MRRRAAKAHDVLVLRLVDAVDCAVRPRLRRRWAQTLFRDVLARIAALKEVHILELVALDGRAPRRGRRRFGLVAIILDEPWSQ